MKMLELMFARGGEIMGAAPKWQKINKRNANFSRKIFTFQPPWNIFTLRHAMATVFAARISIHSSLLLLFLHQFHLSFFQNDTSFYIAYKQQPNRYTEKKHMLILFTIIKKILINTNNFLTYFAKCSKKKVKRMGKWNLITKSNNQVFQDAVNTFNTQ